MRWRIKIWRATIVAAAIVSVVLAVAAPDKW
jgi:hypothetical protein